MAYDFSKPETKALYEAEVRRRMEPPFDMSREKAEMLAASLMWQSEGEWEAMPDFTPARLIETPDGDLIALNQIASVRHWPPHKGESDHRTQLRTVDGGLWELYRGDSEQEALAVRDEMKKRIAAAFSPIRISGPFEGEIE